VVYTSFSTLRRDFEPAGVAQGFELNLASRRAKPDSTYLTEAVIFRQLREKCVS